MQGGAQVVVKNSAGTVIANGHLGAGTAVGTAYFGNSTEHRDSYTATCEFAFTIDGVPDSGFYSVEVGHRAAVTYSRSDMESKNWKLAMSLGP